MDPESFGSWVSEHNLYAFSSFIEHWHLPITVSDNDIASIHFFSMPTLPTTSQFPLPTYDIVVC